jgi:ribosome-associated protein
LERFLEAGRNERVETPSGPLALQPFGANLRPVARIPITDEISIDEDELEFRFIAATGPGGQNVNKVASAAQLRFDARGSTSLPDAVSVRLQRLAGSRLTQAGVVVIQANRFRTQERNRADAIERLVALIRDAAVEPKKRKATRPTKASKERRLAAKTHRSALKSARGRVSGSDSH